MVACVHKMSGVELASLPPADPFTNRLSGSQFMQFDSIAARRTATQEKRTKLKAIVSELGEHTTAAEIREHAYRVGFGAINTSMLVHVRDELWPNRKKKNAGKGPRSKQTKVVLPEGYNDFAICPNCNSANTCGLGKRNKPKNEGLAVCRQCRDCRKCWWPDLPEGYSPSRRFLAIARARVATAKQCTKCKATKPISEFGNRAGDDQLYRSSCRDCTNQDRATKQLAQTMASFGLTVDDYFQLLESQGNRCAICKMENLSKNVKHVPFNVDHCHKTGKVRGLLCSKCNLGIGNFNDEIARMESALNYLIRHQQLN